MTIKDHPLVKEKLAILGGPKAAQPADPDVFRWPIVTAEDEQAVLDVLRAGKMSGWDITKLFEAEYAAFQGTKFALGHCNGTMALLSAMFGVGVAPGDEVICPSITYWASALPARLLGAVPVYADIEPGSLCLDAADLARRITPRTKAVVVVHYCGHPADMDAILAVTRPRGLKVIEDVSHAHGGLYKGRMVGALGDASAASMMAGKSFAIGEGGMLCTDSREVWERAISFGHYERHRTELTLPHLKELAGLPIGGLKGRMNQTCSAMGRVQLRHYAGRMAEIQKAMNHFWDLLEGVPGIRPHRPPRGSGSTMGGWYNPLGHYVSEELGGLPVERFMAAVTDEGGMIGRGANIPLHSHAVSTRLDALAALGFNAPAGESARACGQPLPVAEALAGRCFGIPWFKHDRRDAIEAQAAAFAKVALQAPRLAATAR